MFDYVGCSRYAVFGMVKSSRERKVLNLLEHREIEERQTSLQAKSVKVPPGYSNAIRVLLEHAQRRNMSAEV